MDTDWLQEHASVTTLLTAVFIILAGFFISTQFSVLGGSNESPPIMSYCGSADWMDDIAIAQQCTGVDIAGYRIDVSTDKYGGDGWGCYTDYTVYRHTSDRLEKIHETGSAKGHGHIDLDGLTIKPDVEHRFSQYQCQYVGTEYRVDTPGRIHFNASGDTSIARGENATITVTIDNRFTSDVSGDLSVEFCAPGPFFGDSCITRERDITLTGSQQTAEAFTVPTQRIHGNITVTPTLSGSVATGNDWQGVNWDCDGDGTIEPVDQCTGFELGSTTGDAITVTVGDPALSEQAGTVLTLILERIRSELAFITDLLP